MSRCFHNFENKQSLPNDDDKVKCSNFNHGKCTVQKRVKTSKDNVICHIKLYTSLADKFLMYVSKVNLESSVTPSNEIESHRSIRVPSINKSGNTGSYIRERLKTILLVLLGLSLIPHCTGQNMS